MPDDKIRLGRLWKNRTKDDKPYLSGVAVLDQLDQAVAVLRNGGRLLVLGNSNKRPDKRDPDCDVFVVPAKGKG